MPVTTIGWIHFVFAFTAIGFGAWVAFMKKGTRRHRQIGLAYAWSMVGVNLTAFMIYGLFGHFGPFHVAAVVGLATLLAGWVPVRRKSKDWIEYHAHFMAWSYVGLLAAACAEVLSRIPETPFWGMVIGGSLIIIFGGAVLIRRTVPRILAEFGR